MKFYGIDMQGEYKLQTGVNVSTFVSADDRRLVVATDGKVYYGSTQFNKWVNLQGDDGLEPSDTIQQWVTNNFHVINGDVTEEFYALIYNGPGDGNLPTNERWLKLSVGDPVDGANPGDSGIRIDAGAAGDVGDRLMYWDYNWYDSVGNRYINTPTSGGWWVVSDNISRTGAVAIESWVTSYVATQIPSLTAYATQSWVSTNYLSITTAQSSYVRFVDESSFPSNPVPSSSNSNVYASITSTAWSVVRRASNGDIYANIGHLTATSAYYADLAEVYVCDESLPVGTVVEVDSDEDYEVVPATFELSPTVVGVISENPAHVMNNGSKGLPVALTGKVPVRVIGQINKGDFIVAAGDGLARKGEPHEINFKFGVALDSSLQEGEKMIQCIIK